MAKSSADDAELRRACEAAIEGTKQKIVISIRVVKTHGTWGKAAKLGRQMAKPRVLAISSMRHYSLTLCIFSIIYFLINYHLSIIMKSLFGKVCFHSYD
jgi:hypothetical protein